MANKKSFKIWIPVDIMRDSRTVKLIDEAGYKGLGVLLTAVLAVEQFYMFKPSVDLILGMIGSQVPLKFRKKILFNYGFFSIDEKGNIESRLRTGVCAGECTEVSADPPEPVCADQPAPLSFSKAHIHNNFGMNQKVITSSKDRDADAAVALIKEVLLDQNETLWKQTLLLQSPFAELLSKHWTSAVEFFIQHAIAQAKLEGLYNESEIKRYFARYVMGNNTASLRLRCYLENLDANNPSPSAGDPSSPFCFEDPVAPDGSRSYGGRPIPPDAPPRPSSTAEWNEATDEWQSP